MAIAMGGHLVAINDAAEQSLVQEMFIDGQPPEAFWIGLTDSDEYTDEGQYVWSNGEAVTYTNWNLATGEPNNYWGPGSEDFGAINFQTWFGQPGSPGTWNDMMDAQFLFRGIVEIPAPPGLMVQVSNVAPGATLSGPGSGVPGQALAFAAAVTDPGTKDTHTVQWSFGDDATAVGAGSKTHAYTSVGTYAVTLTVTDDDGASTTASHVVEVKTVDVQPDAADPTKLTLAIGGTAGDDRIAVGSRGSGLSVRIGVGAPEVFDGSFTRVLVFALGGEDQVTFDSSLDVSAEVYGGEGNDDLQGGAAADILAGGPGDDRIGGGGGNDVLIGGDGKDQLVGNGGDDILIGGITVYDSKPAALESVLAEWMREDLTAAQRQAHLTAGGGLNGTVVFNATTVIDDGDDDDVLGGGQDDWFVDAQPLPGGVQAAGRVEPARPVAARRFGERREPIRSS
jgi:PKD repeat protein